MGKNRRRRNREQNQIVIHIRDKNDPFCNGRDLKEGDVVFYASGTRPYMVYVDRHDGQKRLIHLDSGQTYDLDHGKRYHLFSMDEMTLSEGRRRHQS